MSSLTPRERRQMPLLDHYLLLCKENHVRKPNSSLVKLFGTYTEKDAEYQQYHIRRRELAAQIIQQRKANRRYSHQSTANGEEDEDGGVNNNNNTNSQTVAEEGDHRINQRRRASSIGGTALTQEESAAIEEAIGSPPDTPDTFTITKLVLDDNYLGNHALVAVMQLLKHSAHLTGVTHLSMKRAQLYVGDDRPTGIKGNHLIKMMCQLLFNHPSLTVLDLSYNDIATEAYLWLVELCKSATVLEELHLESTLLQDHERFHLESVLKRNIQFHRKKGSSSGGSKGVGNGAPSDTMNASFSRSMEGDGPSGDPASVKFWLKGAGGGGNGGDPSSPLFPQQQKKTYLETLAKGNNPGQIASGTPSGGAATRVITGSSHAVGGAGSPGSSINHPGSPARATRSNSAAVWTAMENARTQEVQGVKTLTSQMLALLDLPHVRHYAKAPEERNYLMQMLKNSTLSRLLLPPSDLGPQLTTQGEHDAKVRVLSWEEKEVVRQNEIEESRKADRIQDILEFLVSVLLKATYEAGEVVIDSGDSSEWVFFVGPGGLVEAEDGSTSFAEGSFFGEEELMYYLDPASDPHSGNSHHPGGQSPSHSVNVAAASMNVVAASSGMVNPILGQQGVQYGQAAEVTGAPVRRGTFTAKILDSDGIPIRNKVSAFLGNVGAGGVANATGSSGSPANNREQPSPSLSGKDLDGSYASTAPPSESFSHKHQQQNTQQQQQQQPQMVLYQMRREVFLTFFGRDLVAQRAMWRRFIETVPAFTGLSPYSKVRLCDAMYRTKYTSGESLGYSARENITFVVDGIVTIKNVENRRVEPKTLARGEYFAFHQSMDDAPAEIITHHSGQQEFQQVSSSGQPVLWTIPCSLMNSWFNQEVVKHLNKFRKFWW